MSFDAEHMAQFILNEAGELGAEARGAPRSEFSKLVKRKGIDVAFSSAAAGADITVEFTPRFRRISEAEAAVLKDGVSRLAAHKLEDGDIHINPTRYGIF